MLASEQPRARGRHPNPIFRLLRPNGAVIVLGLLCALALIECMAAFMEYRERIHPEDWVELEALLEAETDTEIGAEPLIIASEWLGPAARMHLGAAREWESIAYPDLRYESFWVLTHMLERPWAGPLTAELEELERPELVTVHRVGDLTLRHYRHAPQAVSPQTFSLVERVDSVRTGKGACRAGKGQWSCKDGRVSVDLVEVDYRPRRCLALALDDGVVAQVDLGEVELGELVRGHVGFGDFNARLRADPTARVELVIDDEVAGRWLFTDDQGWAAFALRTPPGRHRVQLRASSSVGGTWQREGHRPSPTDLLCIEARGFERVAEGGA